MSLDMKKLKEHKSPGGSPFLEFLEPEGDTFYAYGLKATEELRSVDNKRYNRTEFHARFEITGLLPEGAAIPRTRKKTTEYVEIGKTYAVNVSRHATLLSGFKQFPSIAGKEFAVMNRGRVQGKKNEYMDYAVILQPEGGMSVSQLLSIELVVEPDSPDYSE